MKGMNQANRHIGIPNSESRQENDLYCTDPKAVNLLLNYETFNSNVWECSNGLSHISDELIKDGYKVRKSDIIPYSDDTEIIDFLQYDGKWDGDIITNPPYKYATEFVYKALNVIEDGKRIAMFLSINFLSSKKRRKLFEEYPPQFVYIMSDRIKCAKNGEFNKYNSGAIIYCWIIWKKGYNGKTVLKWI